MSAVSSSSAGAPEPPLPGEPYRGIESFRFRDSAIFPAREEEVWALLSNVTLYHVTFALNDLTTNGVFVPRYFADEDYAGLPINARVIRAVLQLLESGETTELPSAAPAPAATVSRRGSGPPLLDPQLMTRLASEAQKFETAPSPEISEVELAVADFLAPAMEADEAPPAPELQVAVKPEPAFAIDLAGLGIES